MQILLKYMQHINECVLQFASHIISSARWPQPVIYRK